MKYDFNLSLGKLSQEISKRLGILLVQNFKSLNYDIKAEEWKVISFLFNKKGVNQQDISEFANIDKVAVKRMLDNLEKRNIISRKIHKKDKRNNLISLTIEGEKLYEILIPQAENTLKTAFEVIEKDEIENLLNMLNKINQNLMVSTL